MPKIERLPLPNGCSCTPLIIQPSDWKTNVKKDWSIFFRFYEPGHPPRAVNLRSMNHIKDLPGRKKYTRDLLDGWTLQLRKGYNPRLKEIVLPQDAEISSLHPLVPALRFALGKLKGVRGYIIDVESSINGIQKNIGDLQAVDVGSIRTKDLEQILEACAKTNPRFSAYRHNRYRTYLIKLFSILKKHQVVASNPAIEIERLKAVKKIRRTTSAEERKKISDHLQEASYPFWRFLQIFFHSGSRESELMRLRARDVNLQKQTFICLVKKGKQYREEEGIIKNSILPLWKEILQEAKPDQYLFSKGLLPGDKPIRPDQVGRRWALHVKKKLKIEADLYSLKHTNTSAVASILSDEDAARINKHTSTAMVVSIYDVDRKDRQAERLKNISNEF